MKKITILFLFLFLAVSFSNAQIDVQSSFNKKFNVEFRVGPSFPYGDYARKDAVNQNSGFATVGYKAEAIIGYKLIDIIGINLMGFYNSNGTDLTTLSSYLGQTLGGTWSTDSKSWNIYGGLLGFEYSYPASRHFIVGFKAYTGVLSTTLPKISLSSANSSYTQEEVSTTALTYMFSVSGAYPLSKSVFWISSVGYLGAAPNFEQVKYETIVNGSTTESAKYLSQDMKVFVIDTGIRIVF